MYDLIAFRSHLLFTPIYPTASDLIVKQIYLKFTDLERKHLPSLWGSIRHSYTKKAWVRLADSNDIISNYIAWCVPYEDGDWTVRPCSFINIFFGNFFLLFFFFFFFLNLKNDEQKKMNRLENFKRYSKCIWRQLWRFIAI